MAEIVVIHTQDEIEVLKVIPFYLPCTLAANINAVLGRNRYRTWIGRVSSVPATGAGGIHMEPLLLLRCFSYVCENAFSQWRTAYIAHADEQYRDWFHAVIHKLSNFNLGGLRNELRQAGDGCN
ncbi:hypothetical protein M2418_004864 [Rhizobium sp. BIGb0125]|nr:hypothetical protein [Rhizobium sp. BIGb0125]